MQAEAIISSLELAVEKIGDPAPRVYERLFREQPGLEELFFMDNDGGVRGSMLQQCFACIFDAIGEGVICRSVIPSECERHVSYGVEPDVFFSFFPVIRDTFREALATTGRPRWRRPGKRCWRTSSTTQGKQPRPFAQQDARLYSGHTGRRHSRCLLSFIPCSKCAFP